MTGSPGEQQSPRYDPNDPLFRPLSIKEAMRLTGRSERTIERWIHDGRLRTVRLKDPPETVVVERDVLEVERATRRAAQQGRPGPRSGGTSDDTPSEHPGVDAGG